MLVGIGGRAGAEEAKRCAGTVKRPQRWERFGACFGCVYHRVTFHSKNIPTII